MSNKDMYIMKRKKAKVRLRELAEYIGCSQSLISRYENDECRMSENKIAKYKEYINQRG